ncbi:MAG: glycosyl transferase family 1 [Deltaproteobacteria bacterium]|nr:glycosyl transferase family 1 [Deltaproteobacteria bacterium]
MRIALLTYRGNMYCGGQGIYAAYLAREWQRAGHEVHVIAGPPLPSLDPGIALHEIPNANVFGFPMPEVLRKTPVRRLFDPLTFWELGVSRLGVFPEMQTFGARLFLRWPELMRKHRFDVVFDNQQATGVPVVSVIHHPLHLDREADFAIDPSFVKRVRRTLYFPLLMQQQVAKRLARIVTVSEASRREIQRCFGIPEKEVRVVYNGTDADLFAPTPGQRIETDLLFVGRTEDRKKGIGTLLQAMALLPESITLKIIDGRIPDHGLVPRLVEKYGIGHRVVLERRWLELPELIAQYSTARAAVVPSHFEGFGFPASEAMSCGVPVVASDAGALPEVIGPDGHAGRLFASRDPQALATAIAELLALRANGSQRAGARAERVPLVGRRRTARGSLRGSAACCSPSISSSSGLARAIVSSTSAAARDGTASALSSAAPAWSVSTSTWRRCARATDRCGHARASCSARA